MKHFVVEIVYNVPFEKFGNAVTEHRDYLTLGYEQGMILFSGPQVPRMGGMVVVRAESMQEVVDFFAKDPYKLHGLADHRVIQFDPVRFQPDLKEWMEE
jgi:uncharacterized protein YciI